jgi:protein-L-isoaspartate O-methyltransferase
MEETDDERFAARYAISGNTADLAAEFDALGSDYQANGYTTREQADDLGEVLALGPGHLLLDIGSGCGWPGLYLAGRHECAVISIDPIEEGCCTTRDRGHLDGLGARSGVIRADGEAIPLRRNSVDAVVHGDLMC